jgi:hypothetical protein
MLIRIFSLFVMVSSFLGAEIRECSSLNEVLQEVRQDTLFIFDLDNTLLRPCQTLGSDEWVEYSLKKKKEEGLPSDEVKRSVIETWAAVQILTKMRLIEQDAPKVIEKLQEMGFPVMILTSRGEEVIRATRLQLLSAAIDMGKSPVCKTNFYLKEFPQVGFFDGVLYAFGRNKGEVLTSFLHQIGFKPKRILFVDDKKSCLDAVARVEQEGIEFLGLRYNRADPIVRSFDALLADIELEHLQGSLLSDDEARKQLYTALAN